jgi:hypothetical protein
MMQKLLKLSLPKLGFVMALAEVIYVILVVSLLFFGVPFIDGEMEARIPEIAGPIVMLLVFVTSAAISAVLVFGYPAYLAMEKRWKDAVTLALWTIGWMASFVALTLLFFTALA